MTTDILKAPEPILRGYRQVGFRSYHLHTAEGTAQPPVFSNLEEIEQGREAAAHFQSAPWLCPPKREGSVPQPAEEPGPAGAANQATHDSSTDFPFEATGLTDEAARTLDKLCRWRSAGKPEDGYSKRFAEALKDYACIAARFEEPQSKDLQTQCQRLIATMMHQRFLEEGHLESMLLAFGATRGWSEELPHGPHSRFPGGAAPRPPVGQPETWAMRVRKCVLQSVRDILAYMPRYLSPEAVDRWTQFRIAEIRDEDSDIYGVVDVRSWPLICEILRFETLDLAGKAICRQIQLQMCTQGIRPLKSQWLLQAAGLLDKLKLQELFDEVAASEVGDGWQMGIYATFNDKMLSVHERKEVLYTVLKDAPQTLIRKVLSSLDEDFDETERKDDYELRMLHQLLADLDQDIRRCDKAFFRLKRNWISSFDKRTGVIENEELTPAQICDHIEDDPQYEILLKDATNRLMNMNRTFEVAKMLARPKAQKSQAANNIKESQVLYVKALYMQEKEPEDRFAPMAQLSLRLPGGEEDLLRVPSVEPGDGEVRVTPDALHLLERELLNGPPVAVGVWWLWRCFNAHLDMHSRAAVLALTYRHPGRRTRLVLVDMIALEKAHSEAEKLHKDVLGRILSAPHILKVVHFLERTALRALQLAFVTEDVRQGPTKPTSYVSITPCVDVALVTAYLQGTSGVHCNELFSLVWNYMRADMCLTEALGNFERRPLRKTQEHYALSLAWCPLALLRALCSFGQTDWQTVLAFCMKIHGGALGNWDEELLKTLNFGDERRAEDEGPAPFNPESDFAFGGNIWEAESVVIESQAQLPSLWAFVTPREKEDRWIVSTEQAAGTAMTPEQALDNIKQNRLAPEHYPLRVTERVTAAEGRTELLYKEDAVERLEALRAPNRQTKSLIYTAQCTFLTYQQVYEKFKAGNLFDQEFPMVAFYLKNHKEVEQLLGERGDARRGSPQSECFKKFVSKVQRANLAPTAQEQETCRGAVHTLFDIPMASAEMQALHRDMAADLSSPPRDSSPPT